MVVVCVSSLAIYRVMKKLVTRKGTGHAYTVVIDLLLKSCSPFSLNFVNLNFLIYSLFEFYELCPLWLRAKSSDGILFKTFTNGVQEQINRKSFRGHRLFNCFVSLATGSETKPPHNPAPF